MPRESHAFRSVHSLWSKRNQLEVQRKPSNKAASFPVIQTWPPAAISRSNRAARRRGSRWAAAGAPGDEIGVSEDDREQERLLTGQKTGTVTIFPMQGAPWNW
jgi:hypothetical protein